MGNGTPAGDPDDDYEYDQDGNMKADQNKEISYIAYNHANMPTHVQMNNGEVLFTYDALCNKWYKRVGDYQRDEKHGTAYIFGMQYEFKYNDYIKYDWKLMFIGTDEGYVSAVYPDGIDNEFKFQYVYNHTDHLGNIRQNITKENGRLTVLREHNYYPFGLLHRGYNEEKEDLKYDKEQDFIFSVQAQAGRYKYMFQGQEYDDDLGRNVYSYQWRDYDPAIGRFNKIDRFAEKYSNLTPYHFAANNPIYFREVAGDSLTKNALEQVNRLRKYARKEIKRLESKLEKLNKKLTQKDSKGLRRKIKWTKSKIERFNAALKEYDQLEKSNQWYDVQFMSRPVGYDEDVGGITVYDKNSNMVVMQIYNDDIGMVAHEFKHAYQFDSGELAFDYNSGRGLKISPYSIYTEMEADKRARLFGHPTKTTIPSDAPRKKIVPTRIEQVYRFVKKHNAVIRFHGHTYTPINIEQ